MSPARLATIPQRGLQELRRAVAVLAAGPGPLDSQLVAVLVRAWPHLYGSNARAMRADALVGALPTVDWSQPVLSLRVERAAESPGGVRIEQWQVDVQDGVAWVSVGPLRTLPPKADAVDLALAVAHAVAAGEESTAVVRKQDGSIAVRPGNVGGLDVGFAEALPGRHQRFRTTLERAMTAAGYAKLAPYRFVRTGSGKEPTREARRSTR